MKSRKVDSAQEGTLMILRVSLVLAVSVFLVGAERTAAAGDNTDNYCPQAAYQPGVPEFQAALKPKKDGKKKGCESIPYLNLCRDCRGEQEKVYDTCKNKKKPHSCLQDRQPITKLRSDIKAKKKAISDAEKDRRAAADRRNEEGSKNDNKAGWDRADAEVQKHTEKITALTRELYQIQGKLTEELRTRFEIADQCFSSRERVQKVFGWAEEKMASVAPELQTYANQLLAEYRGESKTRHDDETKKAKEARDYCQKALNDLDTYTDFDEKGPLEYDDSGDEP
jgi:hypothetical protein